MDGRMYLPVNYHGWKSLSPNRKHKYLNTSVKLTGLIYTTSTVLQNSLWNQYSCKILNDPTKPPYTLKALHRLLRANTLEKFLGEKFPKARSVSQELKTQELPVISRMTGLLQHFFPRDFTVVTSENAKQGTLWGRGWYSPVMKDNEPWFLTIKYHHLWWKRWWDENLILRKPCGPTQWRPAFSGQAKRFGLKGCEALLPALWALTEKVGWRAWFWFGLMKFDKTRRWFQRFVFF